MPLVRWEARVYPGSLALAGKVRTHVRRALACGTHRPGQHWPAHATERYYARKHRTPLRRRLARALRAAAPALAAFALGSLTTLLATALPT